ncbi:type II toxin-antitoxin system ParD family antitoxin [Breoghania sp. L-A4]|uniref:type II toxin-antitoxin system ParD family antitoxin n=1 Tax=Breoghania sp. L-A4 TaxID=2304600 RepID=UPI000E35D639|nr:type II toxin-antitoxin system ParD family antitoxin [Breoghania sp. L-A4]AXS41927.1 type II toxin-antitoxin system ParD family antitoxin [Breoghania sp. L-A4]
MATMNVSLPDLMKDWVEEQARSGRYANASDYVRDLIRRDQERADKIAAMRALIDEGLADVAAGRVHDFDAEKIIRQARAQFTESSLSE